MLSEYLFYRAISPASGNGGGIPKVSFTIELPVDASETSGAIPFVAGEQVENEPFFVNCFSCVSDGVKFAYDVLFVPATLEVDGTFLRMYVGVYTTQNATFHTIMLSITETEEGKMWVYQTAGNA